MGNYRADQLVQVIKTLDTRTNQNEDEILADEEGNTNIITEMFYPLSEKLTLTDTVEISYYDPTTFCWGDGLTIEPNWDWNGGGQWS